MPRVKKSDGDNCPLCGQDMGTIVSAYNDKPFIDGRYYEHICFECNNVPQTSHFNWKSNELVEYFMRPDKLYTWTQMCSEVGYDKRDAELKKVITKCVRSVKAAIKSMNADTRAEMIVHSKATERRTFVHPDYLEPEDEPEVKRASIKDAKKKLPVGKLEKKKIVKKRTSKKKPAKLPPQKRTSRKS